MNELTVAQYKYLFGDNWQDPATMDSLVDTLHRRRNIDLKPVWDRVRKYWIIYFDNLPPYIQDELNALPDNKETAQILKLVSTLPTGKQGNN